MPVPTYRISSGQTVALGRISPSRVVVPKTARYLTKPTAPQPASMDFSAKAIPAIKQMYLNNTLGDCVIASALKRIGIWTGNESGNTVLATDTEVLSAYHGICGAGDNGCIIQSVLDTAKKKGLVASGVAHKIDDWVVLNWTSQEMVQAAICLLGTGCIGINLPQAWLNSPDIWDVTDTPIIGGHDVVFFGYGPEGVYIGTWGGRRTITWAAFTSRTWIEEAYTMISPDWYVNGNVSPMGVDVGTLRTALTQIGSGIIPQIPDPGPLPTPVGTAIMIAVDIRQVYIPPALGFKIVHTPVPQVIIWPAKAKQQVNVPKKWTVASSIPSSGRMILVDPVSRNINIPSGIKAVHTGIAQPTFYPGKVQMDVPKNWKV